MSYGHQEISTKIFLIIFILLAIMTGATVWWAMVVMQDITRSMGWG